MLLFVVIVVIIFFVIVGFAIAVVVVVVVVGAHGYLCRLTGRQALHLFIFVNHIFAENGSQNVAQITTYAHVEITSVPFAPEIPSRL